jgi:acyl-homoserine-lactone acylase
LRASVGSSFVRFGRARALLLAALVPAVAAAAVIGGGSAASAGTALDSPSGGYQATIRTTSHGIPHILSSNFAGLGYGYGYVAAQANICVLADTYVTANAERSRWFGPDEKYTQGGNGATQTNLNSDFFYQRIKDTGVIAHLLSLEAPRGPRATTAGCATPASTTSPTRAARASRGCVRSPRWTPTSASTSSA